MTNNRVMLWCCAFGLIFALTDGISALAATGDRLDKSPRHHEWADVEVPGGHKVHTWIVYPEVSHDATTVVIIHENKGLTDWVRGVADEVAEAGYLAVAPDLLTGTGPGGGNTDAYPSEDAATKGIYALNQDQVTADLDATVSYAGSLTGSNKTIAVMGFCWGGGQTFSYACHNPKIVAACVFYGPAPKDDEALAKIACPVYGFYGREDQRIAGEVPQVIKRMKNLDKKYEPVIYDRARHGFMRLGEETQDQTDPNR
ncbi:MAG TPA: dienelactone hydrolase family protein, partial [Pirellulales bacterium]